MKKKNKVWEKCKNFLKILGLLFINFFLLFFPDKKNENIKKKNASTKTEEIKKDNFHENKENLEEDNDSSEEARNLFTETYVSFFSELEIREKIKKAFEKETKLEIKKLNKEEEKEYKEIEKKIFEKIQEKKYKKDEEKELDLDIKMETKKEVEKHKEKKQVLDEEKEEVVKDVRILDNSWVIERKDDTSTLDFPKLEVVIEEKEVDERKKSNKIEDVILEPPSKEEKKDVLDMEDSKVTSEVHEKEKESAISDILESPAVLPLISSPILMMVNQELEKEDLEEKQYDHLEEKIALQETQLRVLLKEEADEVKKEQVKEELKKIEVLKKDMNEQKELELGEENKELEEKISMEEKELVLTELKEVQEKQVKELEEGIFTEFENKSEEQIKNIEKILVKERIQSLARGIEIPMLLSFPFIKNKYFRVFTAGLFLHNHLTFLRNLLWRTPRNYAKIDLSSLHKGKDALKKSQNMIAQNILLFSQIEQDIFSKYPELKEDEEFLSEIDAIKVKLYTDYFKLKRKEEKITRNLEKINGQTRKLKRKNWKEYSV